MSIKIRLPQVDVMRRVLTVLLPADEMLAETVAQQLHRATPRAESPRQLQVQLMQAFANHRDAGEITNRTLKRMRPLIPLIVMQLLEDQLDPADHLAQVQLFFQKL